MKTEILERLKQEFNLIGDGLISGKTALKIIEDTVKKFEIPKEIEEAQKYIRNCESDMGFMGSPDYYEKKKLVANYYSKL